jgi:hypothetical protein
MQCQNFILAPNVQFVAANAVPNFQIVAANAVPKFQLGAANAVPNFQKDMSMLLPTGMVCSGLTTMHQASVSGASA